MATRSSKDIKRSSSQSSFSPSSAHRPSAFASETMAVTVDTSVAATAEAHMLTPPPTSARTELAMRIGDFSLGSPAAAAERGSADKGLSALRTGSFFAQNRAILLSGLPQSPPPKESQSPSPGPQPEQQQRGGPAVPRRRHLAPLVTVNSATGALQQHHHHHHHHSASPLQSPRTLSPCVYVKATRLQRRSSAASSSARTDGGGQDGSDAAAAGPPSDAKLTPPPEGRLFVSAYIVPASPDKAAFALRREFDLQELLNAVPRPDRRRLSSVSILPSPVLRSPLSALPSLNAAPTPVSTPITGVIAAGTKRPASDHSPHTPASPHPNLRRHSQQQHGRQPSQKDLPSPDQFLGSGGIPIPIRPHPSLGSLPGLAAIILSRRVEAGDTIELPLPHPEFWPQTVSYVYKSRGELTEEITRNIAHLGGTCD